MDDKRDSRLIYVKGDAVVTADRQRWNDASLSGRGLAKTARLLTRTTGELRTRV